MKKIDHIRGSLMSRAFWAVQIYEQLGLKTNIQIRRLHYQILLKGNIKLPSLKPYSNTAADYQYLKTAFQQARISGFIPYHIFSDAAASNIFPPPAKYSNTHSRLLRIMLNSVCCRFAQNIRRQSAPIHIELWSEQTTAADLVAPIAKKFCLNSIIYCNEIPLTEIWYFVRRIASINKPVRILYISDFSPRYFTACDKLKEVLNQYGLSKRIDLNVIHPALTSADCTKFSLQSAPKLHKYDTDTTELHALEAGAPGHLETILENHIKQYIPPGFIEEIEEQCTRFSNRLTGEIAKKVDFNKIINEIRMGISSN